MLIIHLEHVYNNIWVGVEMSPLGKLRKMRKSKMAAVNSEKSVKRSIFISNYDRMSINVSFSMISGIRNVMQGLF